MVRRKLCFTILKPLVNILFLILCVFFTGRPLILLMVVRMLPLFLLLSVAAKTVPTLLANIVITYLPRGVKSRGGCHYLTNNVNNIIVARVCYTIVMRVGNVTSSRLFRGVLSNSDLIIHVVPTLLTNIIVDEVVAHLPKLSVSYPRASSLDWTKCFVFKLLGDERSIAVARGVEPLPRFGCRPGPLRANTFRRSGAMRYSYYRRRASICCSNPFCYISRIRRLYP